MLHNSRLLTQQLARHARHQHTHKKKRRRSKSTSDMMHAESIVLPPSVQTSSAAAYMVMQLYHVHHIHQPNQSKRIQIRFHISTGATQHGGHGCGGCRRRPPAASAARQRPAPPQPQSPQPGLSKPQGSMKQQTSWLARCLGDLPTCSCATELMALCAAESSLWLHHSVQL